MIQAGCGGTYLCEFKVSLVYTATSRAAKATQRHLGGWGLSSVVEHLGLVLSSRVEKEEKIIKSFFQKTKTKIKRKPTADVKRQVGMVMPA